MNRIWVLILILSTLEIGAFEAQKEKIIICGVGKNVARFLPTMTKKIETLGSYFKDYRVIIYENNSTDQSAALLKEWQHKNPKVMVISEYLSPQDLLNQVQSKALRDKAPCRMELIAVARNKVLKEAMKPIYDDYTYLVMTDLDFGRGWQPETVVEVCATKEPWDCLTANGVAGRTYYDRYAFRDEQFPLGPELIGEDFWADIGGKPFFIQPNSQLKKVYSAFGGIAIFKRNSLKDCWYSGIVTSDLTTLYEYIFINQPAIQHNHQYRKYLSYRSFNDRQTLIQYQPNSGYDSPVCCEHAALFASMILRGHDKIYVHPNLMCYY